VRWRDIEIENDSDGRPHLKLHGKAREIADRLGCRRAWVSLSHSRTSAVAQVVLETEP